MDGHPRQNPAYRPATEKALETGLFLWTRSGEPELLACGWRVRRRDDDRALEDLRAEEGLHQLVVGAVAEQLRFHADRGSVLGRVGGPLAEETAFEDPFGCPPVDGIRGHLD